MNLPNKLSLFRIVIVPVFLVLYYLEPLLGTAVLYTLAPLFLLASVTDFFDGYLARKHNLVTAFGKFIDPLADKVLVVVALLVLNDEGILGIWVTCIIVARELMVTGIRLVVAKEGTVIAASKLGKYKTATTLIGLIILLMYPFTDILIIPGQIVMYVAIFLTIISGFDYFKKNKEILLQSM